MPKKTYLHYSLALLNRQLRKYWNVSLLLVRVIICAFSQNDPLGHGKNINGWRDIVYLDSWACCTVMHSIPRKHLFKVFWSESLQNFPRDYMHGNKCNNFISSITYYCVTRSERVNVIILNTIKFIRDLNGSDIKIEHFTYKTILLIKKLSLRPNLYINRTYLTIYRYLVCAPNMYTQNTKEQYI